MALPFTGCAANERQRPEPIAFLRLEEKERTMDWYLMAWRRYAEFHGRSRRREYWMFALFNVLAMFALVMAGEIGMVSARKFGGLFFALLGIYGLAAVIPSLAVSVRRFHDTGKSGWLFLVLLVLGCIPILGVIAAVIQIVFLCTDSHSGPNQYGPNPKLAAQLVGAIAGGQGFAPMGYSAPTQFSASDGKYGFCKNCGAELGGGSTFCSGCGTHV
jgi:uncharacterized membrane protein YhaH (DUF805 family)